MPNKPDPDIIDAFITELLDKMSLEDKVVVANFSEDDIHVLGSILIEDLKLKYYQLSKKELLDDEEEAEAILREVWKRLRETHRIRVVK